jgi:tRNA (guanine37-N1)-methyltransferase
MTQPTPFQATVLTLFPSMFPGPLGESLIGKARAQNLWDLSVVNIRDFSFNAYKSVDDTPFGGGAGMVLRPDVLDAAYQSVQEKAVGPFYYLSPRGAPLTQETLASLAEGPGVTLLCGRYEGVDERFLQKRGIEEISIGDYILSGGELAAMVLLDGVLRLRPGVLGAEESTQDESFSNGLLEYPHYTRPQVWEGEAVPDVLLSGHHARIRHWRQEMAEKITRKRRPDLWHLYEQRKN